MNPISCHIRPIRPEKDAAAIAGLIRSCFRPWLEWDNLEYLDQLGKAGEEAEAHPFLTKIMGFPYNLPGVVCEDETGKITGVINTFTVYPGGRKCSLISNVCVDPAFRGNGIASAMLAEAERIGRTEGVYGLFLQARMEGTGIYHFYKKNGFDVTDFRETWILPFRKQNHEPLPSAYRTETVPEGDLQIFEKRFRSRYPASILWNLDYSPDPFRAGMITEFLHRLTFSGNRFVRITGDDGNVRGWAAFQELKGAADQLWLVPNGKLFGKEMTEYLRLLSNEYHGEKGLRLDVPAGEPAEVYTEAGFARLHTLVWMWKRL